jgi:hypothetical protein
MKKNPGSKTLIETLSAELSPVMPLARPLRRAGLWIACALAYLALFVAFSGLRHDIGTAISSGCFLCEMALAVVIGLSAVLASAWLCVPDGTQNRAVVIAPLAGLAVFSVWVAGRSFTEPLVMPHLHWEHCFNTGLAMGFIPALALILLSRRGATTAPGLMALMNSLAVAALGFIGLRLNCAEDSVGHAILLHLLPFMAAGIIVGFVARRLYRW